MDAVIRHEWFLALLCFVTPFIGAAGMGTAIAAGVVFLAAGQYAEGGIAIGLVVYNLVGNRLLELLERQDFSITPCRWEYLLQIAIVFLLLVGQMGSKADTNRGLTKG